MSDKKFFLRSDNKVMTFSEERSLIYNTLHQLFHNEKDKAILIQLLNCKKNGHMDFYYSTKHFPKLISTLTDSGLVVIREGDINESSSYFFTKRDNRIRLLLTSQEEFLDFFLYKENDGNFKFETLKMAIVNQKNEIISKEDIETKRSNRCCLI